MTFLLLGLGIILFIILVFAFGQIVWIYLDAKERGDRLKGVWTLFAVMTLFLSIGLPFLLPLPLIIYLIISRSSAYKCPNCSQQVKQDYAACPNCGTQLKASCPSCQRPIESSWHYCPHCSNQVNGGQY